MSHDRTNSGRLNRDSSYQTNSYEKLLFSVVILFAGLRPYPQAAFGTPLVNRLSDLALLTLSMILLAYTIYSHNYKLNLSKDTILVIYLILLISISATISIAFSPVLIPADLFEITRYFSYMILFLAGAAINWDVDDALRFVVPPVAVIVGIQIVLAFGQFFRFEAISSILQWYSSERHIRTPRSVGTFFNPYILSIFLILPLAYLVRVALTDNNIFYKLLSVVIILNLLGAIMMTQSRSVIIVLGGVIIYIGIIFLLTARMIFFKYLLIIVTPATFAGAFLITFFDMSYLYSGLQSILQGQISSIGAAEDRFERYAMIIQLFLERPLIGWGPAKEMIPNIENNFLLYMFRYGSLGFTLFIILLILIFRKSFQMYYYVKQTSSQRTISFYFAIHVWTVALIAGSLSNDFIANPRLYPFLFLLFGIIYSVWNNTTPLYDSNSSN